MSTIISNLCIIPARGGSKRIPRKNIKDFLGKPIIAYSIETAIKSGLFDEVMVSTDDEEIAEIAKKYGARVPFLRSKEKANDVATTFDVIEEVLLNYKKERISFDNACCIYPCAPFVTSSRLTESFKMLSNYDTVFPVVKYGFPIQRALKMENQQKILFIQPEYSLARSQDLSDSYHDAGQFYWFKPEILLQSKTLMTDNTGGIELSELEVQDIDNRVDWKLAELKYKLQNELS
ncbi:pseudaminic acid cytidylyltransferase [Mesonia aestuariivivens]|uniref:Pseudaminic acid cytidylyltransferase n=1 Tax=Mesonia aestuariivivens TaxID=2796128 RepID=A0ABS6W4U1_9FLAO|nr:pseudaminic acid cytidylyltransferase [Mesonia aestuariivivens]MBW2962888.1 pseudaminic acid cytidylyltransferase [Mesonia aestuariivivens]